MSEFKDLNELLSVARQINEGKYDLIDVNIAPTSELFQIAQYFVDSIKKLKNVENAVGKGLLELPAFEKTLNSIIGDSKKASEGVLTLVDNINFNIDEIKELLGVISECLEKGEKNKALGLADRLKSLLMSGEELCFDIISSLKFKEQSSQKIKSVLTALSTLEEQISHLMLSLGIKKNLIEPEMVDNIKESKEILSDQTLVNKLLKEFGL